MLTLVSLLQDVVDMILLNLTIYCHDVSRYVRVWLWNPLMLPLLQAQKKSGSLHADCRIQHYFHFVLPYPPRIDQLSETRSCETLVQTDKKSIIVKSKVSTVKMYNGNTASLLILHTTGEGPMPSHLIRSLSNYNSVWLVTECIIQIHLMFPIET